MQIEVVFLERVDPMVYLFESIAEQALDSILSTIADLMVYHLVNGLEFDYEEAAIAAYATHKKWRQDMIKQMLEIMEERNGQTSTQT